MHSISGLSQILGVYQKRFFFQQSKGIFYTEDGITSVRRNLVHHEIKSAVMYDAVVAIIDSNLSLWIADEDELKEIKNLNILPSYRILFLYLRFMMLTFRNSSSILFGDCSEFVFYDFIRLEIIGTLSLQSSFFVNAVLNIEDQTFAFSLSSFSQGSNALVLVYDFYTRKCLSCNFDRSLILSITYLPKTSELIAASVILCS